MPKEFHITFFRKDLYEGFTETFSPKNLHKSFSEMKRVFYIIAKFFNNLIDLRICYLSCKLVVHAKFLHLSK